MPSNTCGKRPQHYQWGRINMTHIARIIDFLVILLAPVMVAASINVAREQSSPALLSIAGIGAYAFYFAVKRAWPSAFDGLKRKLPNRGT